MPSIGIRHTRQHERDKTSNEGIKNKPNYINIVYSCLVYVSMIPQRIHWKRILSQLPKYSNSSNKTFLLYFYYVQLHHRNVQMDRNTHATLLLAHPVRIVRNSVLSNRARKNIYRCECVRICAVKRKRVAESQQIIIRLLSGYKWVVAWMWGLQEVCIGRVLIQCQSTEYERIKP